MSCADSSSLQPSPYMTITSTAKDITTSRSVVANSGLHNYYYSHYHRNPSTTMQYNQNNFNMSNGFFANGGNNSNIQNGVDMSYFPFLNPSCSNTQYDESSPLYPWATTAAAAIAAAAAYMPQQNSLSEGMLAPSSLLINSPPANYATTQQQLYYSNLASENVSPTDIAHNVTNGCRMLVTEDNTDEMLNSYAALQSQRLLVNDNNYQLSINNSNSIIRTPSTTGIGSWNNISRASPSLHQNITNDSLCSSSSSTSSSVASTSQQDDYNTMLVNGNNNSSNLHQQQYKWMQVKRPISKSSG